MAELRSGTQFRLKLEKVSLKISRKSTNNVYLRFIKDYFHTKDFQIHSISVLFILVIPFLHLGRYSLLRICNMFFCL